MKRWLLLSVPLVGLASMTVLAQAVIGAPTDQEAGVIVREPDPRDPVFNIEGFTEDPRLSTLTDPTATPRTTSPARKWAPLDPATSSPRSIKPTDPAETGVAPEDPDPDVDSSEVTGVELVEPGQVTSPAVEPTDGSTSSSSTSPGQPDGNSGLSGTSGRSGSSNE